MLIFKKVKNEIEIVFLQTSINDLSFIELELKTCNWKDKLEEGKMYRIELSDIDYDLEDFKELEIDLLVPVTEEDEEEDKKHLGSLFVIFLNGIRYCLNTFNSVEN